MKNNKKYDWWVIQTKPQAEFIAIEQLSNQGFITYCPFYRKESIRRHQIKIETVPLFSRYIFSKVTELAKEKIHIIRSTKGVNKLLKIGESPMIVSDKLIDQLKQTQNDGISKTQSHFSKGDLVKINDEIYHEVEAIYEMDDGLERAIVLLNILNKETSLNIHKHKLNKM